MKTFILFKVVPVRSLFLIQEKVHGFNIIIFIMKYIKFSDTTVTFCKFIHTNPCLLGPRQPLCFFSFYFI